VKNRQGIEARTRKLGEVELAPGKEQKGHPTRWKKKFAKFDDWVKKEKGRRWRSDTGKRR